MRDFRKQYRHVQKPEYLRNFLRTFTSTVPQGSYRIHSIVIIPQNVFNIIEAALSGLEVGRTFGVSGLWLGSWAVVDGR